MKDSFVRSKQAGNRVAQVVKSYVKGQQADWPLYTFGAGGIYATAEDLWAWDKAFFTYQVFPKKQVDEILTPYDAGNRQNYGLGWGVIRMNGETFVGHTGGMFGFRTLYEHQLHTNVTIVILSNTGETPTLEIRNGVDQIMREASGLNSSLPDGYR